MLESLPVPAGFRTALSTYLAGRSATGAHHWRPPQAETSAGPGGFDAEDPTRTWLDADQDLVWLGDDDEPIGDEWADDQEPDDDGDGWFGDGWSGDQETIDDRTIDGRGEGWPDEAGRWVGPPAPAASPSFMTDWRLDTRGLGHGSANLTALSGYSLGRVVTNVGLASLWAGDILFQAAPARPLATRPRNGRDPVVVPGHGTVHQGQLDPSGTRPFIYLWIEHPAGTGCEYQWYQWTNTKFAINRRRYRSHSIKDFKAATGKLIVLEEWRPDYHGGPRRERSWNPPSLRSNMLKGSPFRSYDIPGTRSGKSTHHGPTPYTGIKDAPFFCERGWDAKNKKVLMAPIERLVRNCGEVKQPTRPKRGRITATVHVAVRSYLVCWKDGKAQCLGRVDWIYTNTATLEVTWKPGEREAGLPSGAWPWRVKTSRIISCTNALTFGGWSSPCV